MTFVDVTELIGNPVRSGIQRVARAVLAHWPSDRPMRACFYDASIQDLREVDQDVVDLLVERDAATRQMKTPQIANLIREKIEASEIRRVPHAGVQIFIPELFFQPDRARHHIWRVGRGDNDIRIFFHDFIPWLHHEYMHVERSRDLMPFLELAMSVSTGAFNSRETYDDWRLRILHQPDRLGAVIPLGSDGLDLERQHFFPHRRTIVCLGSIDGRKNQDVLVRAFEKLGDTHLDLVLIGYAFDKQSRPAREVQRVIEECPRVRHVEGASDLEILDILRTARATIYLSEMEGFGLPPVESLFAGIPVICSGRIPSIARLPSAGQMRLEPVDEATVEGALRAIAHDDVAEKLWAGATTLNLPTWASFARDVHRWLSTR